MTTRPQTSQHVSWVLLTVLAVVAALHFAEDVLMPMALAILLTFLLAPVVSRLERLGCNREVSVALTTVVTFAVVGALIYVVALQFLGLVENLPLYRGNMLEKIRAIPSPGSGDLERGAETVRELSEELQKKGSTADPSGSKLTRVQVVEAPPSPMQAFRSYLGPLLSPAATAGIVVVLVIFMLLQREDLRDRLVRLLGSREMHTTVLALDDAAERVSRYLMMQTLINTIQGSMVAVGLYLIGVPEAFLWGALTIVLRFIPYLGPLLAAIGPIVVSIAFFPGWGAPLATIVLIVTLELISNNVLEPRLYGSSVGVSSLALIMATVFWTWLWGVPGLFLATPLTVCLVVMGKYIPRLEFLGVVLSNEPVLEPRERFYQRLLADDPEEAEEVLDVAIETQSLLELCDTIVFPALRFVEHDHDRGVITEAKRIAVIEQIGELMDSLPDSKDQPKTEVAATTQDIARGVPLTVLCLPAADRADELAALILARPMALAGIDARPISITALKSEMLEQVEQQRPDAICISAMPPAAVLHARYLCKRLRARFPDVPIVVGLWDARGDLDKVSLRLTAAGANQVVSSAASAIEQIGRLLRPVIQGVQREAIEVAPQGAASTT